MNILYNTHTKKKKETGKKIKTGAKPKKKNLKSKKWPRARWRERAAGWEPHDFYRARASPLQVPPGRQPPTRHPHPHRLPLSLHSSLTFPSIPSSAGHRRGGASSGRSSHRRGGASSIRSIPSRHPLQCRRPAGRREQQPLQVRMCFPASAPAPHSSRTATRDGRAPPPSPPTYTPATWRTCRCSLRSLSSLSLATANLDQAPHRPSSLMVPATTISRPRVAVEAEPTLLRPDLGAEILSVQGRHRIHGERSPFPALALYRLLNLLSRRHDKRSRVDYLIMRACFAIRCEYTMGCDF
jgi:hypothetical protein